MDQQQYAQRVTQLRAKLYSAAMLYFGQKSTAQDVLDEAVYKGLCAVGRLRDPACFEAWMMRIVINECHRESRRRKRLCICRTRANRRRRFMTACRCAKRWKTCRRRFGT